MLRITLRLLAGPAVAAVLAAGTAAQECVMWHPDFSGPDLDETASVALSFDDGSGPALYVGGAFRMAGGVAMNQIARFDGWGWTDVGGGVTPLAGATGVFAMATFNDGAGNALYAAGNFDEAGGHLISSTSSSPMRPRDAP